LAGGFAETGEFDLVSVAIGLERDCRKDEKRGNSVH
jgi:hypothetical protein